jgi:hypothetical protein
MVLLYCSLVNLNRSITQTVLASFLAMLGLVWGIIPQVSWDLSQITFSTVALTQEFSDSQVMSYARAILLIETQRQQAYQQIQKIVGQEIPDISCNRTESLRQIPRDAQKIAVQFCNNSKKIAQNSGLTTPQFNAITERVNQDPKLKKRIQDAMIRIRRNP